MINLRAAREAIGGKGCALLVFQSARDSKRKPAYVRYKRFQSAHDTTRNLRYQVFQSARAVRRATPREFLRACRA